MSIFRGKVECNINIWNYIFRWWDKKRLPYFQALKWTRPKCLLFIFLLPFQWCIIHSIVAMSWNWKYIGVVILYFNWAKDTDSFLTTCSFNECRRGFSYCKYANCNQSQKKLSFLQSMYVQPSVHPSVLKSELPCYFFLFFFFTC